MNGYEQLRKVISDISKAHVDSSNNFFIGTVKSTAPFILHNYAIGDLKQEQLYVLRACDRRVREDVKTNYVTVGDHGVYNHFISKESLKVGDVVLFVMVDNADAQHFIILDKVVKL